MALRAASILLDEALGEAVELMLGSLDVVLAGLAVLLDGLELLLGLGADTSHLDAGVLSPGAGELDVVLAALLGQCRQGDADDGAVIGGVDAEVGLADGGDDVLHGGAVEGADQDGAGLGDRQGGELLERGGGRRSSPRRSR